jgi:DNA-binding response OmpR family regulator
MITIVLIVQTSKEAVFLRQMFLKANIKIISSVPSYASYIKTIQYDPDLVIMEIPEAPRNHLQFLRVIRSNKAIEQKPFILYGPPCDEKSIESILDAGADVFLTKPLNIKELIGKIRELVGSRSKRDYKVAEINQLTEDERLKLSDPEVSRAEKWK